jgi:hypothetical protein
MGYGLVRRRRTVTVKSATATKVANMFPTTASMIRS